MDRTVNFYNQQLDTGISADELEANLKFISWTRGLKQTFATGTKLTLETDKIRKSVYRPYFQNYLYFNKFLNEMQLKMPYLFPSNDSKNLVISVSGVGASKGFSTLIMDKVFCLDTIEKGQGFPLYIYEEIIEEKSVAAGDLFDNSIDLTVSETKYRRKDGISDEGLQHFQTAYPNEQISKEDIF
nr:type ISP restriction/modification enzyme [Acinetobacter indicus]